MSDQGEVQAVDLQGAVWRMEVGAAGGPEAAAGGPEAIDPPLAEVRVLIREWKSGGAEVRIDPGSGGHTIRDVVALARQELLSARDLLDG